MKRRIEVKESQTAEMMCACRTISFYENSPYLKSGDYIAPLIIPPLKRWLVRTRFFKKLFLRIGAPGAYEYVVARTKYIDAIFQDLDESFTQVLILGAALILGPAVPIAIGRATVYEVDAPPTQTAKVAQYRKVHVAIPANLKFVAVDFEKETLAEKLSAAGLRAGERCLFLLEGLTMYLDAPSVDTTFALIGRRQGQGVWLSSITCMRP